MQKDKSFTWKAIPHCLPFTPIEAKMIALADKLSNIKAIQKDYEQIGNEIWNRFNMKDPKQHAWYYCSVAKETQVLSDTGIWKEYSSICEELFSNL